MEVEVLGTWFLFPKAMDAITRGMVHGLAIALVSIVLVLTLSLGSLRLGLAAAVPNAIPIAVCLGVAGWLGLPLSFGASIAGCVALGLAVDGTVYVLSRVDKMGVLADVYQAVGRPVILTTTSLAAGFAALGLSEFVPVAILGWATTLALGAALLCNLLVLPSVLAFMGYAPAAGVPETTRDPPRPTDSLSKDRELGARTPATPG